MQLISQSSRTKKKRSLTIIFLGYLLLYPFWLLIKYIDNLAAITLIAFPLSIIIFGTILFFRARQYEARESTDEVLSGSKSQVLYLRAFRADATLLEQALIVFNGLLGSLTTTAEEQLVEALEQFGTVVAMGEPGERLPKPGAARLYASAEEWKEVVIDKMKSSQLVVLRAGKGEALFWELKQALALVEPKRLLILVLDLKKKDYESFRKATGSIFVAPLPEAAAISSAGRVSGFLRFSSDWKPSFLPMRAPFFRLKGHKPHRCLFTYGLKPVTEDFGLEWREPPVSWSLVTAVVILLLAFGVNIIISGSLVYWWKHNFPTGWTGIITTILFLQGLILLLGYLLYRRGLHRPSLLIPGAITIIGHEVAITTILLLIYRLGLAIQHTDQEIEKVRQILK